MILTFEKLLKNANASYNKSNGGDEISEIIYDSRAENPSKNAVFVCIKGFTFDSHEHAEKMYKLGVRHFVSEHALSLPEDAVIAVCPNTRRALAVMSSEYFGNPSSKLKTIALTGTKGKTSTSFMIRSILEEAGHRVGVIGTTGIFYGDVEVPSDNSTPESYLIHKYMSDMVNSGCDCVVMEASSQGFKLDRTYGIEFDIGVFTNLSPDHIGDNEHKDFDEYLNCKKMLFSQCKTGIFNTDDKHFAEVADGCTCKVITFGYDSSADYKASSPYFGSRDGKLVTEYDIAYNGTKKRLVIPLLGEISVYNSLCAAAVADTVGCSFDCIDKGLKKTVIRGRNESVDIDRDFSVILDYAHNDISTESIFKTLSHYKKGRIITVFGCGGNRSKLRRYGMGDIVSRNSDITIITSDNPRFEKLDDIISDILSGIKNPLGEVTVIKDRRQAIYHALSIAKKDDIVLIAGKGNQDYEEIEGVKYPFDEREIVKDYFRNASR